MLELRKLRVSNSKQASASAARAMFFVRVVDWFVRLGGKWDLRVVFFGTWLSTWVIEDLPSTVTPRRTR